jgi:hypothetical protein
MRGRATLVRSRSKASGDELPTHTEPGHDHVGLKDHYNPFTARLSDTFASPPATFLPLGVPGRRHDLRGIARRRPVGLPERILEATG